MTFFPLWAPLVLAAWTAVMLRPFSLRIARAMGRDRAAAVIVVLLVMAVFVPLLAALGSLTLGAMDLARSLAKSGNAKSAFISVVQGNGGEGGDPLDGLRSPGKLVELVQEHGMSAVQILGGAAGAVAHAVLGTFIFFYATYVFLIDGPDLYEWIERHAPIEPTHTQRLAAAFVETGRGLFVGIGLTGFSQGIVATITYFALGVPRAFVLGLVTCLASLIPSVGTGLVWVPVAIGLALAGRPGSAAIMVGVGVCVIALIDNVLRPVFARFGKLHLSTFILLTSIFGGLAIFGTWGLFLGPLFVRMAKEALELQRKDRLLEKRAELDAAAAATASDATPD
ncbi:MAG: AI-2E family transporter [Labilithrix sp.]|nr:AI-2E family transporter [Labilithrix sp.]